MFNYKVEIDEALSNQCKVAFTVISQGSDSFSLKMFETAKRDHPELLEWMNSPGKLSSFAEHPDFIRFK